MGLLVVLIISKGFLSRIKSDTYITIIGTVTELYKVFVEQSNPFLNSTIQNLRCQFICATLLLAGVIISNAYKNVNVYNMMQPRHPITYQTADQLLHDNFTLYTRLSYVMFYKNNPFNLKIPWISWRTQYFTPRTMNDRISSRMLSKELTVKYDVDYTVDDFTDISNETSSENSKTVIPIQAHRRAFEMLEKFMYQNSLRVQKTYTEWEEQQLFNDLSKCSKTAIFLPEVVAMRYQKQFQTKGLRRPDIGAQIFQKPLTGVSFYGFIKMATRARIRAVEQAGILLKWEKLYNFDVNKEAPTNRIDPTAAELSGNVFIIFVLLGAGLSLSVNIFVTELLMSHRHVFSILGCI